MFNTSFVTYPAKYLQDESNIFHLVSQKKAIVEDNNEIYLLKQLLESKGNSNGVRVECSAVKEPLVEKFQFFLIYTVNRWCIAHVLYILKLGIEILAFGVNCYSKAA